MVYHKWWENISHSFQIMVYHKLFIKQWYSYEEAISDIDSSKWIEAIKFEIDSMHKNQVWDLVEPLEGIVPIGNK